MPTTESELERIDLWIKHKNQLKSHVAMQNKSLTVWIREAIAEKIEREMSRPPVTKVIVAGHRMEGEK